MTNAMALKELQDYYDTDNPTEDDEFRFTEALGYLIDQTKDPKYMYELGWFYCSKKRFDLEIRYLEMASEYGYIPAMEELGYMWYYGQHGQKDYDKAFYYFSKGAVLDESNGGLWCKYKLADMYRYGCAVEKDEDKYREMIEEAYEQVRDPKLLNDPFPEIAYRLAGIRAAQERKDEAIKLLKAAKDFMAERLSVEAFWGHIEVMGRIVCFLYELIKIDWDDVDLYDLFYLTEKPGRYDLTFQGRKYEIEAVEDDDGTRALKFGGKWYRSFADLCQKAELNGEKLTSVYDEIWVG